MNPSPQSPDAGEQTIFDAARQMPDAPARAAYLDAACAGDAPLRERVEKLLQANQRADEFLASDPLALGAAGRQTILVTPVSEALGTIIGNYKLLEKLGEGGFGVVYMAEQKQPIKRRVALKIIKVGMDTHEVVARFEAERQALAVMDHPNIAKIYDAGATDSSQSENRQSAIPQGRPYFVMELVRGIKITDYCDEKNLSTRERLDLFTQVCQAVQHAHQKGIIHRDLKPSNILVTVNDGVAVPKIIDFGIAKATQMELTEKTVFTRFHQFLGTPAYMSPEQAEITSVDIDTRSDIYSLGVLLYELLTGKTPFDANELLKAGLDEMRRTIREKEPDRPSTRVSTLRGDELTTTAKRRGLDAPKLVNVLRGDLDWMVMKCLEKDRARRYETANGLATDIQRHLNNEPVVACPPSNLYKFHKLVRRNKFAFTAAGGIAAALVIGLAMALWQSIEKTRAYNRAVAAEKEAKTARKRAEANEKKAQTEAAKSQQVAQFLADMLKGVGPYKALGRDTTLLREILQETDQRLTGLTNQPEVEAYLRTTLGKVYEELGDYTNAVAMHRRGLELHKRVYGDMHQNVAFSLDALGQVNLHQGRLNEAEAIHRQALAMRRKLWGNEHIEVSVSLHNLAVVLREQSRLTEAEEMQREALAMQQKFLGKEHPSLAISLNNLALVLHARGKLDEAEAVHRQALKLTRRVVGNEHPDVALSLANLASVLSEQGNLVEAEEFLREALAMRRKFFGNEHHIVANSLSGLGATLHRQGRLAEAETMFREELAMERKVFGNEHPDVAASLHNLAGVLGEQGKLEQAETTGREALALARKIHGNNNPRVAQCICLLARVLVREHRFEDAQQLYGEALSTAAAESIRGDVLKERGNLYARRGLWKEAEADLTSALELESSDHMIWYQLAGLRVQTGMSAAYDSLCLEAAKRFQSTTVPDTACWIARACLIARSEGTDLAVVGSLADRAVDAGTTNAIWQRAVTKALAEYRAGRVASASDWAQRAAQDRRFKSNAGFQVETLAILAMAQRQLQKPEAAKAALAEAIAAETKLRSLDSGDLGGGAISWIVGHALLREAKALIENKAE